MVQQAYSLRGHRHALGGGALSHEDLLHPAATAAVAAGLKPGMLTLQAEKKRYGGNRSEYLEARDFVLLQWEQDKTRFLSEEACIKAATGDRDQKRMVREVYRFLMHQGCINLGFLKDDPLVPLPEGFLPSPAAAKEEDVGDAAAAAVEKTQEEPEAPPPEATDESVEDKLYEILSGTDLQTTSEKMLRKQLAEFFNCDMSERKTQVRELVMGYLDNNGPPPLWKARKAKETAAKEAAEAEKNKHQTPHRRPLGKVIVIGGGPSGLSAALHLKRNNVEVTVLEARERVGGRVNSHTAPGFDAPVDLGASIITGIEADTKLGARADPSALLCSQLGVTLHQLQHDVLPLHNAVNGGLVEEFLDKQVERLRDEMLDDVADVLDEMNEEEISKASFGVLLERSFEMRKNGPAAYKAAMKAANDAKEGFQENVEEEEVVEDAAAVVISAVEAAVPPEVGKNETADGDGDHVAADLIKEKEEVDVEGMQTEEDAGLAIAPFNYPIEEKAAAKEENEDDTDEAGKVPLPETLSDVHLQFLNWHWANLEYGCSAPLSALSAKNWNQDEDYGGFGGPHCMVVGGYDQAFTQLASLLDVRLDTPVASVKIRDGLESVEVITESGESFWCDAVVVTVPLGVLKAGTIGFEPALPPWKKEAIERLGFGDLNKVILQFPEVFWDDSVDFFGAAKGVSAVDRGFCFMWWNFHRFAKAPILAALVSGESATTAETTSDEELKAGAMDVLRALHPGIDIPEPVACTVSRWASEKYTKGSYSYVAVGADGGDYDKLAIPVSRRILFAGEHTIKEHPDTVGGAMLSGLREAARAIEILENDKREGARGAKEVGQAVAELKRKHAMERGELGPDGLPASKKSKKNNKKKGRIGVGDNAVKGDTNDEQEESDEDEDDIEELRYGAIMGHDVARRDQEMYARERSRAASKEVWRCLMAAEMNDVLPLLEIMDSSRDVHSRHTVSNCLVSASVKALKSAGADERCVKELASWVSDSASESSLVALLDQILKALCVMPIEAALARSSGLAQAVKRCTMHGDPDVRKLAGYLSKQVWAVADGEGKGATSNGNGAHENRPISPTKLSGPAGAASSQPRVTVTKVAPPKIELDEDTKRQMAEAEAQVQRLEAAAATLAAEAAAAEAEAQMILQKVKVRSFSQFKEDQKKKPKTKISRAAISDNGGGSNGAAISDNGGSSNGAAIDAPEEKEGEFNFKYKLHGLLSSRLRPHLQSHAISKDAYKEIRNKASEKIMSRVTADDLAQGRALDYYEKRKKKFIELVDAYISGYRKK